MTFNTLTRCAAIGGIAYVIPKALSYLCTPPTGGISHSLLDQLRVQMCSLRNDGKRLTNDRVCSVMKYDPDYPSSIIHLGWTLKITEENESDDQIRDRILAFSLIRNLVSFVEVMTIEHHFQEYGRIAKIRSIQIYFRSGDYQLFSSLTNIKQELDQVVLEAAARAALGSNRQADLNALCNVAKDFGVLEIRMSMDGTTKYEITHA